MPKRRELIEEPDPTTTKSDDTKGQRLSIQLDDSGAIAWDRMRPSTKDQLLAKLRDDATFKSAGGTTASASKSDEIFSDPHAAMVFDMLGRLEVSLAMRAYHCTPEQAAVLLYSEQEKALLTGPLVKVLNKYGASWFTKYGDEIALAGLLVSVHMPKIVALQDALKQPGRTSAVNTERPSEVKLKVVESS